MSKTRKSDEKTSLNSAVDVYKRQMVDRLNNVVQEGLTAIRAVKAFVRDEYEEDKFNEVNTDLTAASEQTFHYAVLNLPAFQGVMYTCLLYTSC